MSTARRPTGWSGLAARIGAALFLRGGRRRRMAWLFRAVFDLLRGTETVLDLGCGSGFLTLPVAERLPRGRVVAVDVSREMLERLTEEAAARGLLERVLPLRAAAHRTGLAETTVHVAVSSHLLHELEDPEAVFREVHRVLVPGGWGVFADFRHGLLLGRIIRMRHSAEAHGPYRPGTLAEALTAAGFAGVRVEKKGQRLLALFRKPS